MASINKGLPHYRLKVCADEIKTEEWLNQMAEQGYRVVSITPLSATNHYTKDTESTVWVLVALPDMPVAPEELHREALVAR
ncbi:MAG TPA: hypothetical protein VKT32_00270 [Chthonomonadaceae bacterium]|nr:hypothetical protein [Chthonomonadaceae bacterium]